MDVGGGELAEFFAGGAEVGGAAFGAVGDEDGACFDGPDSVGLDENEFPIFGYGGDSADEAFFFFGGFGFFRFFFFFFF